jgi:hypothetical protein
VADCATSEQFIHATSSKSQIKLAGYIDVFSNSTGSDEVLQICLSLVQKLNSVYSMRSTRFVFGETLWKTTTTVHANSVPLLRTIAINLVHQRRKEIARRIDAILGQ